MPRSSPLRLVGFAAAVCLTTLWLTFWPSDAHGVHDGLRLASEGGGAAARPERSKQGETIESVFGGDGSHTSFFTTASREGRTLHFVGKCGKGAVVRYGGGGEFAYMRVCKPRLRPVPCHHASFNIVDPAQNKPKSCQCIGTVHFADVPDQLIQAIPCLEGETELSLIPSADWKTVCSEASPCDVENAKCGRSAISRYGAQDGWIYRRICHPDLVLFECDSFQDGFGRDPKGGVKKTCQCIGEDEVRGWSANLQEELKTIPCFPFEPSTAKIRDQVDLMMQETVVDPRRLRRQALAEHGPKGRAQGTCKVTKKPSRPDDTEEVLRLVTPAAPFENAPRVLCLVYTMPTKSDAHSAILDTWGAECDGIWLMSTVSNPETMQVKVHHVGEEAYTNMWQKTRSIWAFVHAWNLRAAPEDKFDWFMIGGDDIFVIPNNLRAYVAGDEVRELTDDGVKPVFLGQQLRLDADGLVFNSGGAGYVLNAPALDALGAKMDTPKCSPATTTSREDVYIARCLRTADIRPSNTRDADGGHRFHLWNPVFLRSLVLADTPDDFWYKKYAVGEQLDFPDAVSPESVSFHYMSPQDIRHAHRYLYSSCRRR